MKRTDRTEGKTLITDPVAIPGYVPGWSQRHPSKTRYDATWDGVERKIREAEKEAEKDDESFDYSAGIWHPFKTYRHDAKSGNKFVGERTSATYTPKATLRKDAAAMARKVDADRLRLAQGIMATRRGLHSDKDEAARSTLATVRDGHWSDRFSTSGRVAALALTIMALFFAYLAGISFLVMAVRP